MKRVASAAERDMVGLWDWRELGLCNVQRCTVVGRYLRVDVNVNVNVEKMLARRNWKSLRE